MSARGSGDGPRLSRRRALTGAAGLGVATPLLAACADDGEPANTVVEEPPATGGTPTAAPTPAPTDPAPGTPLATTSEIAVGGGTIYPDAGVVVTQPSAGEFRGFSVICTHERCPVTEVVDGQIICPCHRSAFSVATGEPLAGPAARPLATIDLVVEGDRITLA